MMQSFRTGGHTSPGGFFRSSAVFSQSNQLPYDPASRQLRKTLTEWVETMMAGKITGTPKKQSHPFGHEHYYKNIEDDDQRVPTSGGLPSSLLFASKPVFSQERIVSNFDVM